jgi:hypothetical protein
MCLKHKSLDSLYFFIVCDYNHYTLVIIITALKGHLGDSIYTDSANAIKELVFKFFGDSI